MFLPMVATSHSTTPKDHLKQKLYGIEKNLLCLGKKESLIVCSFVFSI